MTTEEKAKAYDKALKRAKAAIDIAADKDLVKGVATTIFPELCESEDEKIRRAIIKFLTEIKEISESGRSTWAVRKEDAEMCKSFIAYLEKQKEPLPIPNKFSGLKSLMLQYLQSAANRKDDVEIESDTDLWGRKILDYVWKYSDEQKEQKPIRWPDLTCEDITKVECTFNNKQKEQKPINESNMHEPTLDEARKWNEAYEKGYSLGYKNGRNELNE